MATPSALRYLELMQQQVYTSLGLRPFTLDRAGLSKFIDGYLTANFPEIVGQARLNQAAAMTAQMEQNIASLPTRYEDPTVYGVLRELVESLEETGKAVGWPLPPRPVFGTLPTGRVNALTVRVPRTHDYLVLFESDLFLFTMLLSKAVLQAFPEAGPNPQANAFIVDNEAINRRLESEPSIAERFADTILNYVVRGSPRYAVPYYIEPGYVKSLELLKASSELFVLGHEYGHIVAKHLEKGNSHATTIQGMAADAIEYSWFQECEADAVGVRLCMGTMKHKASTDAALGYWGAELFFAAIDVVDRAVSLLRTGDEAIQQLGSHPPAKFRRTQLRAQLLPILTDPRCRGAATDKEQADAAAQLGSRLEYIVEQLWKRTRSMVLRLRTKGYKPAASWSAPQARAEHA